MINKQKFFWLAVLGVGIVLVWYGFFKGGMSDRSNVVDEITPGFSVTPEATPTASPTQEPQLINKYPPAECSLTGSITFISPTIYENNNANIIYKNIDSIARHIIWAISPDENLSVGPNLFASLPLPDGVEDVTVVLPNNPKSKNYIMTAKVTYGVFVDRILEIKESSCTGQIPVDIKY